MSAVLFENFIQVSVRIVPNIKKSRPTCLPRVFHLGFLINRAGEVAFGIAVVGLPLLAQVHNNVVCKLCGIHNFHCSLL